MMAIRAWLSAESYEFLGEPLTKTVDDLAPASTAPTPTRRTTRGLKAAGFTNTVQYGAFRKGGIDYKINDCIFLETDEQAHPYKGKIISIYRDEKGEDKLKVRWLYTAEDARKPRSKKKKTFEIHPNEIFYSNEKDATEIENACGRFEVFSKEDYDARYPDGPPRSDSEKNIYFCRRMWDERQEKLGLPVRWADFLNNTDVAAEELSNPFAPGSTRKRTTPSSTPATILKTKKARINRLNNVEKSLTHSSRKRTFPSESENDNESGDENFLPASDIDASDQDDEGAEAVSDDDHGPGKAVKRKSRPGARTPKRQHSYLSATSIRGLPRTPSRKSRLAATPLPSRAHERSSPTTEFDKARERLHVSNLPDSLPCREMEYAEIYGRVESAIEEASGSCIYIAGVPGTGKTATVHAVMRNMLEAMEEDEISPFQFVEINGMKLTEPAQSYSILWQALTGNKVNANHAGQLLEKRFNTSSPNRQPVVVLMDELDLLVTKNQQVMYNFFNWPNLPHARLIVLAVANTMDLPERILTNRVSSRLGLTRIKFEAYTHQQLIEIVESRLEGVQCFERDAIELCARKIGAISGDARRALDICRRGVELLEYSLQQADKENKQINKKLVTMSVIDRAVKEMFASPAVQSVARASIHQRVFLVCVLRVIRRTGTSLVEFNQVADEYVKLCSLGNLRQATSYTLFAICEQLNTCQLLMTEQSRAGDYSQRIQLSINTEDVITAVRSSGEEWLKRLAESS